MLRCLLLFDNGAEFPIEDILLCTIIHLIKKTKMGEELNLSLY